MNHFVLKRVFFYKEDFVLAPGVDEARIMLLADQYEIPRLGDPSGKILVKDLCASNVKHVMKTLKACTKCDAIDTFVKAARKKVHATPAMIDASHKRDARAAIAQVWWTHL